MTFSASALQDDKTYQGDVIVKMDRSFAMGAMRGGGDNGLVLRDAVDADIEKTPYNGSQDKTTKKCDPAHGTRLPFLLSTFK